MDAELAAARLELRLARADIAALKRRLMRERDGAQLQLESTVAVWRACVASVEAARERNSTDTETVGKGDS